MAMLHFQRPALLAALAVLPAFALLWWRACRIARRAASPPGPANAARGALRLLALAALLAAAAGPVALRADEVGPGRAPVVFVLDVSASMAACDVAGFTDRLGAARQAVRRLADLLPEGRLALVANATEAAVVCPPTADRGAFLSLLERAQTRWMGEAGSLLGPGLREAHQLLRREGGAGVVVLVSDGEGHGEPPLALARRIGSDGGLLHTVTVGLETGAPIVTPSGKRVVTSARPQAMAALARAGGGRAWSVGPQAARLPGEPDRLAPPRLRRTAAVRAGNGAHLGPWLCALAALLLAVSALLRR